MKRTLIAAAAALLLPSGAAEAAPYVGVNLNVNTLDVNQANTAAFPQSTIGGDFHGGYRFDNLNLAGELGYGTSRGEQTPDNLRINMLTGDALYYVPIGGFLNIVLTAGIAEVNYGDSRATYSVVQENGQTKSVRTGNTIFHGNEFDWRVGPGFSFALADGYEVHLITRYQPLSMGERNNYSLSLSFGMNFYF